MCILTWGGGAGEAGRGFQAKDEEIQVPSLQHHSARDDQKTAALRGRVLSLVRVNMAPLFVFVSQHVCIVKITKGPHQPS